MSPDVAQQVISITTISIIKYWLYYECLSN